ncbi:flagellar basal body-associated FliL family protein [Jannaschia sp. CCS1]|uniref:flagellar basal body-associated FliL family protein n=1 Tax=Jannaschia sp. (strain CCS1) TaxID=290400 RepID=UPI000053BBCD|nr:flagellar basal body-associated FliL family protein [Jannaschia sp. CCS1]ABD57107.1 hypothetical protein Jann_4190 [Jannaschia sp. CCS1]
MMRLLLPIVLLLIGVGGGVGAGILLSGGPSSPETAETPEHAEDEDHEEHAASGETQRVEPAGEGTEYVRINNQFVVPIVRSGAVRSLVVMSLSLEVDTGVNSAVFSLEPRLRDSFLRVMFAHANAGGFDGRFTEAEAMAPLRSALREAAQSVLGRGTTHDVLITDITRQDA